MIWRNVFAIAKKDWLEVRQNQAAWLPMVIVPLIFVLIMPLAFILIPTQMNIPLEQLASDSDLAMMTRNMPAAMAAPLQGLDTFQQMVMLILGYMFAPLFLMFPLMFSTVIAAESFAGERERKTIEALLYSGATDAELFVGKALAAGVPAILITWLSFAGYALVLNTAGFSAFGRIWFPLPFWYPLIFWVSPALTVLGIAVMVLVSVKVQTFMGAYQLGGSLVILVLGLMIGQLTGVLYLSVGVGMLVGLVVWLAAVVLIVLAVRSFNRSAILASAA
jgi:ABC-type Na+ efflux pump permease subunit